jgi:hypothetical protein
MLKVMAPCVMLAALLGIGFGSLRTGIVYTTLEAPMEKTQGIVVAGRCTMVSFQGLKAGTVESILNIWSSAL